MGFLTGGSQPAKLPSFGGYSLENLTSPTGRAHGSLHDPPDPH